MVREILYKKFYIIYFLDKSVFLLIIEKVFGCPKKFFRFCRHLESRAMIYKKFQFFVQKLFSYRSLKNFSFAQKTFSFSKKVFGQPKSRVMSYKIFKKVFKYIIYNKCWNILYYLVL